MAGRKLTPLLRRRQRGDDDKLSTTSGGSAEDNKRSSIILGRHTCSWHSSSSVLVKTMLTFGALALGIFCGRILLPHILIISSHGDNSSQNVSPNESNNLEAESGESDDAVVTASLRLISKKMWSRGEFRTMSHCDRHLRVGVGTKALPTLDYWQTLRDVYNSEVDSSFQFDDPVPPTQGYTLNENGAPPYYADLSAGKGRGLFASRDIMKGELVDGVEGGTKSDMVFPSAEARVRYLLALPEPMACDVLEWTYTSQLVTGGPSVLLWRSDISSLMNSAWDDDSDANVMPKDSKSSNVLYATRDITRGEEILMDYGVFPTALW